MITYMDIDIDKLIEQDRMLYKGLTGMDLPEDAMRHIRIKYYFFYGCIDKIKVFENQNVEEIHG